MKSFPFFAGVSAALLFAGVIAFGQSTSNPDNTSAQAAQTQLGISAANASPSPTVSIEPPSLIPPNILPGPGAHELPKAPIAPDLQLLNAVFKNSSLGKAADAQRLLVATARLQERIQNDPELLAEEARANRSATDLEKRLKLKTYYHHYYNKLRAMADTPELKAYLDAQEIAHQTILSQPRVRHDTNPAPEAATTAVALPTPIQAKVEQGIIKRP